MTPSKQAAREALARDCANFAASGGIIKIIPTGQVKAFESITVREANKRAHRRGK